jgi:hypothetical protein
MVISGVAERIAPAIRSLVFLDAFVPRDGEAAGDLTSPALQDAIRSAVRRGESTMPARSAEAFGVNEADRAWVDGLCRPQPIATLTEKIGLTGARDRVARKSYIRAASYVNPGFDRALAAAKSDPSWRTYEVSCGHDVMVDAPDRLTEILLEAAD